MFETLCTFCPWFLIAYESETHRNGAVTTVYRVMPSCAIAENGPLRPLTGSCFRCDAALHFGPSLRARNQGGGELGGVRTLLPFAFPNRRSASLEFRCNPINDPLDARLAQMVL